MERAIGVFDSGVGGLTVLRELNTVLPLESTLYLGDNGRNPYGPLPADTIREYTLQCLDHLYERGVKALVIACNTATTAAFDAATNRYDVPVIGVIGSTAKVAASVARGRVGIMATQATVNSGEYPRAIKAVAPQLEIAQQACPLLTLIVEAGEFATRKTEIIVDGYLQPLREARVDTVVLGCTHYPFLRPVIEKLMGPEVQIVECGPSTVASLVQLMEEGKVDRATTGGPEHRMLTTGGAEAFRRVAATLWPEDLPDIEEVTLGQ